MSGLSALILGATGATGKHLLREVLASDNFTRVGEYGRRVTAVDKIGVGKDKLQQKVIDFEKLEEAGLKDEKFDVVFITLGTTRATAGSAEAFEKIDREYVINAARVAKSDETNHPQKVIYVSSGSADPNSLFLYPKSKGLTEIGIAELGYKETIVFRPGLIAEPEREETRIAETIGSWFTAMLAPVVPSLQIPVYDLAKSVRIAGELGIEKLPPIAEAYKAGPPYAQFTVIGNKGAAGMAKSQA